MSKTKLLHVFVLIVLFFGSTHSVMCKNPVLKKSKWTAVLKEFVADAGTMTITHTLEFTSAKEVRISEKTNMPSYPAMYMNPDGTVDTIPGWSSEKSETGTYKLRRGKLTIITTEDGLPQEYTVMPDGTLVRELPWGETLVFSRSEE